MTRSSRSRLSEAFADLLGTRPSPESRRPGALVGLEHEYTVVTAGEVVDFRGLIHQLGLGAPRLDPADPNAYRMSSGAAVTADGAEAEIALPPLLCTPGFSARLSAGADAERRRLLACLPVATELVGYSTHLSISVPPGDLDRVALLYATTFAPAMMLLLDRPTSLGLLVRPRPGRLELGGTFIDGLPLSVAALFAVGSVRACAAAVSAQAWPPHLPMQLRVRLEGDRHRYGFAVRRCAFGDDLYDNGRGTRLVTADGAMVLAQHQLERAWAAAREALGGDADLDELAAVEDLVASSEPLPRRATHPVRTSDGSSPADGHTHAVRDDVLTGDRAYGTAIEAHSRPGYDLAPVMLTWDAAVFVIANPDRSRLAYACVPAALLDTFARRLGDGALDTVLRASVVEQSRRQRLARRAQLERAAIYDELGHRAGLLARERNPTLAIAVDAARKRRTLGSRRVHPVLDAVTQSRGV